MIAAVAAAGPKAQLWTLDGGVQATVKQFGVKLAPESSSEIGTIPSDVRAGLDNVGLQGWEIASDGTPIRRGQLLPGAGTPSGKAVGPGGGGKPPAQGGQTPAKPAKPSGPAAGEPPQVKGSGGAKPATGTDVEPPAASGGGAGPAPKFPASAAPQPGRFAGVGVAVGSAALSLGFGLLSSYLKARVDRKIAAAQIDRNQAKAVQVINGQVDTILKMMMTNPDKTLYARVYMASAVSTTYEVNATSPEPTTSDSSPIIDLTGVGFTFVKLDPALADTFQGTSGGGRHTTMVRLLISEIPLETPPIEDLIAVAKARKLPLDELHYYVLGRLAGVDQKEETQKFIADVNHWKHILDLTKVTLPPSETTSPIETSRPPAQSVKTKPRLDSVTKKTLASAPSRVTLLSENVSQYKTAYGIQKKLTGNASFVVAHEEMGGGANRRRTVVSYWSDLDKPRAAALVEIVRSEGVASVYAELSGDGDDAPGVLQINFGRDAEK